MRNLASVLMLLEERFRLLQAGRLVIELLDVCRCVSTIPCFSGCPPLQFV